MFQFIIVVDLAHVLGPGKHGALNHARDVMKKVSGTTPARDVCQAHLIGLAALAIPNIV